MPDLPARSYRARFALGRTWTRAYRCIVRLAAILNALFTGAPGLVERNDLEFRLLGFPDRVQQALREFAAPPIEFAQGIVAAHLGRHHHAIDPLAPVDAG